MLLLLVVANRKQEDKKRTSSHSYRQPFCVESDDEKNEVIFVGPLFVLNDCGDISVLADAFSKFSILWNS